MSDLGHRSGKRGVWPVSAHSERRRACRYVVAFADGFLLGWGEDLRFENTPCRVIDLSLTGCMIESRRFRSRMKGQTVRLRLDVASPGDWMEGIVVSAHKPLFQHWQIRIRFLA